MDIESKHLAAIEIIREKGGLTQAAIKLKTSQPALSRLLSELEARLGAPLFDRTLRPWKLTALGEALALQGRAILSAQSRAHIAVSQFQTGDAGLIKLGGTPYFTDSVVTSLVAEFQQAHPELRIDVLYGYSAELTALVRQREIDLALCPLDTVALNPALEFTSLALARNVIACRTGHPLMKLTYPRPLALLDYGWVVPPAGSPLAQDLHTVLSGLGMSDVKVAFSGGSLASVLNYLRHSDCLSVLPESTVKQLGDAYDVATLKIETSTPHRRIGIITNSDDFQPNILKLLIEFIKSRFE